MKAVLTVTNLEKNIKWQQCEPETASIRSASIRL